MSMGGIFTLSLRESAVADLWQSILWIASVASLPRNDERGRFGLCFCDDKMVVS